MSALDDYKAEVKARGWVFVDQLPRRANDYIKANVEGKPGSRSPWSADRLYRYELAPLAVRIEYGFDSYIAARELENYNEFLAIVDGGVTDVVEAIGLDNGLPGVAAKALGIPPWVLLVVLVLIAYAILRNFKIVPPVQDVIA